MEKEIKLTKEEAQVLLNMLNIAVKATGIEAAEAALHFTKKIQDAFKEEVKLEEKQN